MEELFSRKWLVATVATWIIVIVLDEVTYTLWKKINPGASWTGLIAKHPTQSWPGGTSDSYPNGYRPAGGQ